MNMNVNEFENMMRDCIVKAYVEVMGIDKWNSLTNAEKDAVLHYCLIGVSNMYGVA